MNVRMIQAVLTPTSQEKLLSLCKPIYKKIHAHHVTIVYNPSEEDLQKLAPIIRNGQRVHILIGDRMWANGVEAITAKVYTEDGKVVPIKNEKPHITISTEDKPPVLSNDMLANKGEFKDGFEGIESLKLVFHGIIEFI